MKICMIDVGIFIDKPELLEPLKAVGEVEIYKDVPETVEEVVQRAADSEVIMFAIMQFTNEMLDKLPKLKILQFVGTGVSNFVDVEYAESKGIKVLNITGYGSNAVAEFAVGMGLALARNIIPGTGIMRNGQWKQEGLIGKEISNSIVGIIGTGSIGKLVAEKYVMLGAKVIACDIYENYDLKNDYGVEYKTMEKVFSEADLVSLHMIVTPENQRMIGKDYFALMKPQALLVNVARSELVNTEDLLNALTEGTLSGAAIDVYDHEPPSDLDFKIANLPNVVATPHIAYYTEEASDNSIILSVDSVINALENMN